MTTISERGIAAQGQKELRRHQHGERLTARQAMRALCYDCMGGYIDGKRDCGQTACPLHPYMPYRTNGRPSCKSKK